MRLIARCATLPLGFLVAAVAQRALLAHAPRRISVDLAQPLVVATNWHGFGLAICAALALGLAIAAVGYVALVRSRASLTLIFVTCAVALACAAAVPVLLSSDVYAYAAYGAMMTHGIDPYARAPLPPHDPLFTAAIWQWSNPMPICVYGPFFVALAGAVVRALSSFAVAVQLDGLRVVASLALLACVPLAAAAFGEYEPAHRRFATALIAANPIVIWSAAEGHNDALMLAIVLAGFALLRRQPLLGNALVALSALVKAPGIVAAFAPLFVGIRRLPRIVGAFVGAAIVAATFLPFASAIRSASGAHAGDVVSLSLFSISPVLAGAAAIALLAFGIRRIVRDHADGWCLAALAAWVAIPNPYPWYGLWFLPVAAVAPRTRPAAVIVALSFTTALRYLPDAVAVPPFAPNAALSLFAFAPLAALVL